MESSSSSKHWKSPFMDREFSRSPDAKCPVLGTCIVRGKSHLSTKITQIVDNNTNVKMTTRFLVMFPSMLTALYFLQQLLRT